jgi:hypothetical protein
MSEITLSGLAGSHPLGALAAFGLLRCCEEMEATGPSRLYWTKEADWLPILVSARPLSADDLVAALAERQKGRQVDPELCWSDNIKTDPDDFRAEDLRAAAEAVAGRRGQADFMAAFGCELAVGGSGKIEPTAFYMTSGQQKFLKEVRTLATRVGGGVSLGRRKKGAEELFREALFGPWRYEDPQHSLGWDPSAERLHALRSRSPTKEAPQGVAAAVWLAFEALPLFPCFLSSGSLATRGFARQGRGPAVLSWPVWKEPASLEEVRSLVGLEALSRVPPAAEEMRARGIMAIFRSERYRVKTQGAYYILRPASPCA